MRPGPETFGKPADGLPARRDEAVSLGRVAKAIEDTVASYGVVHFRPEWEEKRDYAEIVELEALAVGRAPKARSVAERIRANQSARKKFFKLWFDELVFLRWWIVPGIFCGLQLACFFQTGDSLFGNLTGGVVESLRLATTGRSMFWHFFGGIAMWAVAAVQFLVRPFRHGRLAFVHRTLGRLFLVLWMCIVGPTAVHLSLFCGTGPMRAQFWMTVFAIVSADTALHAYYFFWRAWVIIRRRASEDSVVLHRKAVTAGSFFTMTILWQRPLQAFAFIGLRRLLLRAAGALQVEWPRYVALNLLDHNVGLSVSTALIGFPSLLLDGPRSWLARSVLDISEEQAEELYGSREPGTKEVLFWRFRHPVYLLLRALVTDFWTVNPDP